MRWDFDDKLVAGRAGSGWLMLLGLSRVWGAGTQGTQDSQWDETRDLFIKESLDHLEARFGGGGCLFERAPLL